jgi:hypothetical protein
MKYRIAEITRGYESGEHSHPTRDNSGLTLKGGPMGYEVDGYWYVATPYTHYPAGRDAAYRDANSAAAQLCQKYKMRVYAPIGHSHSLCAEYGTVNGITDSTDGEFWKWFDEPLLDASHGVAVVMMPGWSDSSGVLHEIAAAKAAGRPVLYFTWPALTLWEVENGSA